MQVMTEMGSPYSGMEVASFMSCSKGYMGECGMRYVSSTCLRKSIIHGY